MDLSPARLKRANVCPLNDRIVVEQPPEATDAVTEGGIIKPEQAREKPLLGLVIAVGEGYQLDNGMVRPLLVQVGDHIVFGRYAGVELPEALGANRLMMREDEVLGILKFEED